MMMIIIIIMVLMVRMVKMEMITIMAKMERMEIIIMVKMDQIMVLEDCMMPKMVEKVDLEIRIVMIATAAAMKINRRES